MMEMRNTSNGDLLQLDSNDRNIVPDYYGDFNMDDLLVGDDYMNCLIGPDVNLATFNMLNRLPSTIEISEPVIGKSHAVHVKSPWHESDSGVSQVSESLSFVGSTSDPNWTGTDDLPPMSSSGTSDDLMTFLFGEKCNEQSPFVKIHQQRDSLVNTSSSASGRPMRKCCKRKFRETKVEYSESDDCDDSGGPQGTVEANSRQAEIHSVNLKKKFTKKATREHVIVKIVKPTTCTSEDVLKALDERSTKNAQQAKVNREKKKIYIKNLEDDRNSLMKENTKLSSQIKQMTEDRVHLETEVEYLKSVLANASALSGLLKNINNVKEVKLSASLTNCKSKRVFENDHSYNLARSEKRSLFKNAGVCLHVNDGEASLEFCSYCSSNAQNTYLTYDGCGKS